MSYIEEALLPYNVTPVQGRTPTGGWMSYADTQRASFPSRQSGVPPLPPDMLADLATDSLWGFRGGQNVIPRAPQFAPSTGSSTVSPGAFVDDFGFVQNGNAATMVDDLVEAAPRSGRFSGLGARAAGSGNPGGLFNGLGYRSMTAPVNTRILGRVPGLARGGLGAGLLRGGAYGAAGQLGGGLLEQLADSQGMGMAGDVLGSAARFAPLGAFGGPLGVGVAAGLGGLWGLATGDRGASSQPEQLTSDSLKEALSGYVEPLDFARADDLVEVYKAMGASEEEALQQAYAPLIAQVEQGAAMQAQEENILALQMASQAAMAPIVAQSNQRLRQFEDHMNALIPTLPQNYQNVFRASVPEVAMWQGLINDANQGAALTAPLADYIRNAQFDTEAAQSYSSALADDPLLSQFTGG